MGTRANNVVTDICATFSYGLKMRIEKVGGIRKGAAVSSLRQLCFSWEEKMTFCGEEMMFHMLEVRSKSMNVAEIKRKKY